MLTRGADDYFYYSDYDSSNGVLKSTSVRAYDISMRNDSEIKFLKTRSKGVSPELAARPALLSRQAMAMKAKAEKALKVEEKMDFFSKFGEQASKQKRDAQNHYLLGLVALANGEKLTENDAVHILHEKRAAIDGFIGESFGTIAAVDANAALPHYEPQEGKGAPIKPPCILLVDSGAHYDKGTTDTTRVWFLGNPDDYPVEKLSRLKRDYTAVFQAMKTLSESTFKPGTNGVQLDKIARGPIHAIGANFGHGTGHGIGLTLNVHETPPSISPREREGTLTAFEPGMVTSDEPGIYRPGEWGIRIENMLVCVEKEDGMLGFETLTQCEIDQTLLLINK